MPGKREGRATMRRLAYNSSPGSGGLAGEFTRMPWGRAGSGAENLLKIAVHLGTVLDAVDADDGLWMIDPVKNAPIAHPQFAKSGEIVRHADQPPMHHDGRVFRQPEDFALDTRADGGVEFAKLHIGSRTYFDPIGHGR